MIEDHQKEINDKERRIVQLELWRRSINHIVNELILETGADVNDIPDKVDSEPILRLDHETTQMKADIAQLQVLVKNKTKANKEDYERDIQEIAVTVDDLKTEVEENKEHHEERLVLLRKHIVNPENWRDLPKDRAELIMQQPVELAPIIVKLFE